MDLIGALLLIVVILLALNHAGGGHHSAVLRPATGIARRLISMGFGVAINLVSSIFRIAGRSIRLPGVNSAKSTTRHSGPPQPRWKE